MNDFIPPFEFARVFVEPWTLGFSSTLIIALMGFFITAACGLVGNFLMLRRLSLIGDAISHSVLPGLAIAFLLWNSRGTLPMFAGALASAVVTTLLIEVIHRKTRVKEDAAIGIVFSALFAIGVLLIALYADKVDLDQDCVLYGEIAFVPLEPSIRLGGWELGPEPLVRMGVVALAVAALVGAFYKELLVTSFDAGLAFSLGLNTRLAHYALMGALSVVVVSAFQSVGAILVIAMLILPGATARLLSDRLPRMLGLSLVHAAVSSVGGVHLATWLDCTMGGAMVMAAALLFVMAWIFSPSQGLLRRFLARRQVAEPAAASEAAA